MDKKEYIGREAFYKMIETKGKDMGMTVSNRLNCKDIARMTPNADVVSRELFEQIKWERDVAMEQLAEHGISFGEKMTEEKHNV